MGVHANMCVLGRPFGLRQMAQNGKHVVLMRDMTDTMYNPSRWPYVGHFHGTELVVEHIEKFVCPTITSDQVLGGKSFHFKGDVPLNEVKPQALLGRWDLVMHGGDGDFPSWLEVRLSGHRTLVGSFVGQF